MTHIKHTNNKHRWLMLGFLLAFLVAGSGAAAWKYLLVDGQTAAEAQVSSAYQTAAVRRGDLALTISGNGKVVAAQEVELSFPVAGIVAEVLVRPGDIVTKGQELARLDKAAELEQALQERALAVQAAEKTLNDLNNNAAAALAQAEVKYASAEQAYAQAATNLVQAGDPRCPDSLTRKYWSEYFEAQKPVDYWEAILNDPNTGHGRDFILERLVPARKTRDLAYWNWKYCEGYTEEESEQSQANWQYAQASLEAAAADYQALKTNAGIDPLELAIAQAALEDARLQLNKAQRKLEGIVLHAPITGTVLSVNGSAGQSTGTGVFITVAELAHPLVQANIDEIDLPNFAVGCGAKVTFDSLPGQLFEGVVSEISPALVTVQSVGMVQGLVDLASGQTTSGKNLPLNLAANVEVTCRQASDALLISAQALYEPQDAPAYVYILNGEGIPEKRDVDIGIKTVASVEITGGLMEGERVVTSQIEGR